jgi:hypothetical protein
VKEKASAKNVVPTWHEKLKTKKNP